MQSHMNVSPIISDLILNFVKLLLDKIIIITTTRKKKKKKSLKLVIIINDNTSNILAKNINRSKKE